MTAPGLVIWHDLECGGYREDVALWRGLAADHTGPILDVGAGTGRVALELARAGHAVVALDRDPELLAALHDRAGAEGLTVTLALADARSFTLHERFGLCVAPMQTIQLLGGSAGRRQFLTAARAHMRPGGRVAIAISEFLEPFVPGPSGPLPLPDIVEHDGTVYCSQPTAVRAAGGTFVLERRREVVDPRGGHEVFDDKIALDALTANELEREASEVGLRPAGRAEIPSTDEYVGSTVVMCDA